jgi:hypothetical protein
MIRRLLWCCIWLSVVSNQWLVVSGQTPMTAPVGNSPSPVSNLPSDLPCLSSESACLRRLGDLAVSHNLEIRTLDQAIALGRKKQWTTWLNADGLNPLAMGLRIVRNIAGGGDRAALKLEMANLERRRAEVETNLRQAITQAVSDYEAAEQRLRLARSKLAAHEAKLKLLEVTYRLGAGETEVMLTLWQQCEEMQVQVVTVEAETITQRLKLKLLTHPAPGLP